MHQPCDRRDHQRYPAPRGFTLIELMVVVAILALLGTLAVNIYKRYVLKARTSEAISMLAHIKAKQDAYQAEHYRYAHIPTYFPTTIARNAKVAFSPLPGEWSQLGLQSTAKAVYFQYNTLSDQGNVANNPPAGRTAYGLADGTSWFVATALGKFDSDTVDTTFEIVSNRDTVWKVDKFGNRGP